MFVTIYLTRHLALRMQRQTPGEALTICPDICQEKQINLGWRVYG